jgi:acetyltransferase-like isoleucine patch superfamily enzyme
VAVRSLNRLIKVRQLLIGIRRWWFRNYKGAVVHPTSRFALSSRLVTTLPRGIVVDEETAIAFKTLLFTRDLLTGTERPIRIGRRCFIGGYAVIGPGVTIGEECIVGAGAVVMQDVPPRSIVAGNPGRIVRSDISVGPYGRKADADARDAAARRERSGLAPS